MLTSFHSQALYVISSQTPNGLRHPLVGGTRQRYFVGASSKPRKLLENAQSPTSRVHAVLGNLYVNQYDG